MIAWGLEILAQGKDVLSLGSQILHSGEHFVIFFAEAQHKSSLGGDIGMRLFSAIEKFERALIEGTFANLAIEAGDGLGVVVKDVWLDGQDDVEGLPIAPKVRD